MHTALSFAVRSSYLSSPSSNFGGHTFKDDREVKTPVTQGYGLIPVRNTNARPAT